MIPASAPDSVEAGSTSNEIIDYAVAIEVQDNGLFIAVDEICLRTIAGVKEARSETDVPADELDDF